MVQIKPTPTKSNRDTGLNNCAHVTLGTALLNACATPLHVNATQNCKPFVSKLVSSPPKKTAAGAPGEMDGTAGQQHRDKIALNPQNNTHALTAAAGDVPFAVQSSRVR